MFLPCKTKAIQAVQVDSHIFRHNQVYSGIIHAYSEPCVTLVYLEPSHIQSRRHITYSEPEVYSKPCQTSTMGHYVQFTWGQGEWILKYLEISLKNMCCILL